MGDAAVDYVMPPYVSALTCQAVFNHDGQVPDKTASCR